MKLNDQMSREAAQYAKSLADRGAFEHSKSKDGENLAMGCSSQQGQEMTAAEATRNWYDSVQIKICSITSYSINYKKSSNVRIDGVFYTRIN